MATIVAWALYLSTAICWQEPELLFGTLFTLAVAYLAITVFYTRLFLP